MRRLLSISLILIAMTYSRVLAESQPDIELELPEKVYAGFKCTAVVKISNPSEGGPIKVLWIRLRTPWGSTPLKEVDLEMPPGTNLSQEISLRIPLGAKAPAFANLKAIVRIYDVVEAEQITLESEGINVLVEKADPKVSLEVNTNKRNLTPSEPFELLISYTITDFPGEENPTLKLVINGIPLVENLSLEELSEDLHFNLTAPREEGTYEIGAIISYIVGEKSAYTTIVVSREFGFRKEEAWNQIIIANRSLDFANTVYKAAKEKIDIPEKASISIQFAELKLKQAIDAFNEANNSVFLLTRDSYNASTAAVSIILKAYQDNISVLLEALNLTFRRHVKLLTKSEAENITRSLEITVKLRERIPQEPENASLLFEEAISQLSKANSTLNGAISRYNTKITILSFFILIIITISFFGVIFLSRSLYKKVTSAG